MPDYSWDLMMPHTDVINTPIISDCDLENGAQSGIGSHSLASRQYQARSSPDCLTGLYTILPVKDCSKKWPSPIISPLRQLCVECSQSQTISCGHSVLCAHTHAASAESGRAELGSLDSGPALSTFTAELPVTKHFISEDSARARTFSKQ